MNSNWIKADSWYRRDVGDGTSLTVSRDRNGTWSWRRTTETGAVMAGQSSLSSAPGAVAAADQALVEMYGKVAV
jgi:hypothetical protein